MSLVTASIELQLCVAGQQFAALGPVIRHVLGLHPHLHARSFCLGAGLLIEAVDLVMVMP